MSVKAPISTKITTTTPFILKGLAITLPPVLTLVILIWITQGLYSYIICPISWVVKYSFAQTVDRSRPTNQFVPPDGLPPLEFCGLNYRITPKMKASIQQFPQKKLWKDILDGKTRRRLEKDAYVPFGNRAVPYKDYQKVARKISSNDMPDSAIGLYMEFVTYERFQRTFLLSTFVVLLSILILYFVGGLVTARVGSWGVHKFETTILGNLPFINSVYSSVKQVTDFLFTEPKIEYKRVVAVEYPRHGVWSLGFATGDSLLEMTASAGEPLVSVLVPTSPMPMTGYTINIPRNEIVDLNMTIDQAFQFCLSCGVLVPAQQKVTPELLQQELAKRLTGASSANPATNVVKRPSSNLVLDNKDQPESPLHDPQTSNDSNVHEESS